MADEAFALSPISARAALPSEADYDAIREAFMETSRGRWFLTEYAKRNRNADTTMVLDAVARIEQTLAAQKQATGDDELAKAVAAIRCTLEEAKAAAKALITTKGKAEPRDWIKEPNQIAANEVDRAYWTREKRNWPVDLMGGQRHRKKQPLMAIDPKLRQAILDTERVLKDDEKVVSRDTTPSSSAGLQLEHYDDGYPKLPACLDRRIKLAEAACT